MFPLHLPSFCLCDCETVFANCLCVGGSWLDSIEYFTNRWCMWLCTYVCLFVAFKTTCAWVDFLKNMLYRNTVSCCFSLSWLAFFLSRLAFRFFPFLSPFFSSILLSSLKTCFVLFFFFFYFFLPGLRVFKFEITSFYTSIAGCFSFSRCD